MESKPDRTYHYIGHVVDHFSKFHILFPMHDKSAQETVENLRQKVFSYFGLPSILQSDNGTEFVNDMIKTILVQWPGNANIVNGNPRHCQSQGLVEQGNNTIERMISSREYDSGDRNWSDWLPEIQCKRIINNYFSQSICNDIFVVATLVIALLV